MSIDVVFTKERRRNKNGGKKCIIVCSYECSREMQRGEIEITKLMVAFAVAAMRPRRCRRRVCIYVTNLYKYVL